MQVPIFAGERVAIVGGKYTGKAGYVVNTTAQMCTIRLLWSEDAILVMLRNVELDSSCCVKDKGKEPRLRACQKQCCRLRTEACTAAREELLIMRARIDELIRLFEKIGMN
jgi:hypothetical protein